MSTIILIILGHNNVAGQMHPVVLAEVTSRSILRRHCHLDKTRDTRNLGRRRLDV